MTKRNSKMIPPPTRSLLPLVSAPAHYPPSAFLRARHMCVDPGLPPPWRQHHAGVDDYRAHRGGDRGRSVRPLEPEAVPLIELYIPMQTFRL